jgi:hypothetical protein
MSHADRDFNYYADSLADQHPDAADRPADGYAHQYADEHADRYTDGYAHQHANRYTDQYADQHTHQHADGYTHQYADQHLGAADGYTNQYSDRHADALAPRTHISTEAGAGQGAGIGPHDRARRRGGSCRAASPSTLATRVSTG